MLATLKCCVSSKVAFALARQAAAQARAQRQGPIDIEPVLPEGAGWVSARGWWRHIEKCCLSCRSWTQQCIHRRVLDHVLPITSASHRHLCRHLVCQLAQQVLCQLVRTAISSTSAYCYQCDAKLPHASMSATQSCHTPRVMQSCKDHNVALPNAQQPRPAPVPAVYLLMLMLLVRGARHAGIPLSWLLAPILAPIRNSPLTHIKFDRQLSHVATVGDACGE